MTKITKLDKAALKNLREPIEAELKALGERLGLSFTIGNGSFGDGAEASFKLILKVDDPAVKLAADKAQWDRNCQYIGVDYTKDPGTTGLRADDFGTEFEMRGTRYRTNGLAVGRSKYPVRVEVMTGPKAGGNLFFTEQVVPIIRAATDAAKPKVADAA